MIQTIEPRSQHAGAVFLHPTPVIINGHEVELSVPATSVKVGSSAVDSNLPLLPRSTARAKKTRVGLGFSATSKTMAKKASEDATKEPLQTSSKQQQWVEPVTKAGPTGKNQDDFRKMLG